MTAYATVNTKTKKELKERIAKGEKIRVRNLTPFGETLVEGDANVTLSGPHYPEPHKWYGEATVKGGYLTAVK